MADDLRMENDDVMRLHLEALAEALDLDGLACYAVEYQGAVYTCLGVRMGPNGDVAPDGEPYESAIPLALLLPAGTWAETSVVHDYAAKERPDAATE